jgi:hypothetical protein
LKKGEFCSAGLQPILICKREVSLSPVKMFLCRDFWPKMFAGPAQTYLFYVVLRFICLERRMYGFTDISFPSFTALRPGYDYANIFDEIIRGQLSIFNSINFKPFYAEKK